MFCFVFFLSGPLPTAAGASDSPERYNDSRAVLCYPFEPVDKRYALPLGHPNNPNNPKHVDTDSVLARPDRVTVRTKKRRLPDARLTRKGRSQEMKKIDYNSVVPHLIYKHLNEQGIFI